jgi:hypothetical protein
LSCTIYSFIAWRWEETNLIKTLIIQDPIGRIVVPRKGEARKAMANVLA